MKVYHNIYGMAGIVGVYEYMGKDNGIDIVYHVRKNEWVIYCYDKGRYLARINKNNFHIWYNSLSDNDKKDWLLAVIEHNIVM